jgi:pterin-4a-carbinolamine dehydratase
VTEPAFTEPAFTEPAWPPGWTKVARPSSLSRRFEFDSYADTRAFLDRLETLSKETGLYPDLSFSRSHVNVTIYGPDGGELDAAAGQFAARTDALAATDPA